jgi:hypothetical protein
VETLKGKFMKKQIFTLGLVGVVLCVPCAWGQRAAVRSKNFALSVGWQDRAGGIRFSELKNPGETIVSGVAGWELFQKKENSGVGEP